MYTSLPRISILVLQKLVQTLQIKLKSLLKTLNSIQSEHPISINKLKDSFGALHKPLLHVFNLSIVKEIFPDDLKIAHVTSIFKGGDEKNLGY